jgi:transcriptional regulator with XRE-family HTH domain
MNVSENIKTLLAERGWTPERLAVASQDAGYPIRAEAIRQWLNESRTPNAESIYALSLAFGCTTDAILRGDRAAV